MPSPKREKQTITSSDTGQLGDVVDFDPKTGEIRPAKVDEVIPPGSDRATQAGSANVPATQSPWRPDFDTALPAEIEEFIQNTKPDDSDRDPEVVSMEIMRRILQAKSLEEVFAGSQLVHAGEILNTPITVYEIHWHKSDFMEGPGRYCVVQGWDHIMGHEVTVSIGGINSIAQLYMASKFGAFPIVVEFQESPKPTARGYRPIWLRLRPDVPAHVADQ